MFWSLAAKKCPHSCTKMMVARTAMASMVLAGPSSSKPVFRRPAPRPASPSLGAEAANGGNHSSTSSSRGVASSTSTTGVAMSASSSLASGSPFRTMEDARSGAIDGDVPNRVPATVILATRRGATVAPRRAEIFPRPATSAAVVDPAVHVMAPPIVISA